MVNDILRDLLSYHYNTFHHRTFFYNYLNVQRCYQEDHGGLVGSHRQNIGWALILDVSQSLVWIFLDQVSYAILSRVILSLTVHSEGRVLLVDVM